METIAPSFVRVLRGLVTLPHVLSLFERLESDTEHVTLTDADRLAILDLPEPDIVISNLASATHLSKQTLLERAASSPDQLSTAELTLLRNRYWADLNSSERHARISARQTLDGPGRASTGHSERLLSNIEQLRAPYYEANESDALSNARFEKSRRFEARVDQRVKEQIEKTMASPQCPEWAKHMLRAHGMEKGWGFAKFVDPNIAESYDMEIYEMRVADILDTGAVEVGHVDSLGRKFKLQHLDWPEQQIEVKSDAASTEDRDLDDDDDEEDDGDASIVDLDDERLQRIDERDLAKKEEGEDDGDVPAAGNSNSVINNDVKRVDDEDDEGLRAKFDVLRKHFRTIRERGGIKKDILTNVFTVMDDACASSLFENTGVDNVWVWAIDPDYDEASSDSKVTDADSQRQYRGFLRVRLQQLVDKFFEARKFHEEEYPMATLWQAAQNSRNRAFVSTKSKEQRLRTFDEDYGSALGKSREEQSRQDATN